MKENKFKITNITGNPANVVTFFFDKEIPWQVRLGMFLFGCMTWGTLFLQLYLDRK